MHGKRVHIVPVGDDVDRMVGPAIEMRADVVYLLAHTPERVDEPGPKARLPDVDWADEDSVAHYVERLDIHGSETASRAVERLADRGIEAPVEFVDQDDVYAVLGLATTLAYLRSADDDVAVNVSTGTRLATIGTALARMDESTAIEAYHVSDGGDGEVAQVDGDGVADVPDYHLESPARDELAAMAVVAARDTEVYTPKKSDLIDWALRLRGDAGVSIGYADRIVRSTLDSDPESDQPARFDDLDGAGKKGAYRTLRTQVLDELVTRDFVDIDDEQVGRADLVTLTPSGEAALRAFRHKILDVVEALEEHRGVEGLPPWLSRGLYRGA
jgi:hypothetical protein